MISMSFLFLGSLVHPASHPHALYNSLYSSYPYPQQKLQPSPPPAPPHQRTTPAHCWPSSHSVTDILAGVHAAAFRGAAPTGHHHVAMPPNGPGGQETGATASGNPAQNYNYYMYLQSGNTAAAMHVMNSAAAAGMAAAHHGLATGTPL